MVLRGRGTRGFFSFSAGASFPVTSFDLEADKRALGFGLRFLAAAGFASAADSADFGLTERERGVPGSFGFIKVCAGGHNSSSCEQLWTDAFGASSRLNNSRHRYSRIQRY